LLILGERPTGRDSVPFGKAGPAAGGGGVLGNKHGMAAKRRLFAVIRGHRYGEAPLNEITCMLEHDWQASASKVGTLARGETKPPPEW
jgi:hypothetical protein